LLVIEARCNSTSDKLFRKIYESLYERDVEATPTSSNIIRNPEDFPARNDSYNCGLFTALDFSNGQAKVLVDIGATMTRRLALVNSIISLVSRCLSPCLNVQMSCHSPARYASKRSHAIDASRLSIRRTTDIGIMIRDVLTGLEFYHTLHKEKQLELRGMLVEFRDSILGAEEV
jgi:hypothetical protein